MRVANIGRYPWDSTQISEKPINPLGDWIKQHIQRRHVVSDPNS